jgi:putative ATP-dependent endonuclease of the OLD family
MRINRIQIDNFLNFHHFEIHLDTHAVIVGENKVGKSNLLHALRLVLDPRLPDYERKLRLEDFWDGLPRPLSPEDAITISVDLTDFENNENLLAVLADHIVESEPMVARLTYVFRPSPQLDRSPQKESDYEFVTYGGGRLENSFGYDLRSSLPMTLLPALRNAEEDLFNWRKSPLAPLLEAVAAETDPTQLEEAAANVSAATDGIASIPGIQQLGNQIKERLEHMVGPTHAADTSLGFSPTDAQRLIRTLRLFIDNGTRGISDASLGCANLIYLSLLSLDLERQVREGNRRHTVLAIEEPEAHLHPHLQRLVFRDFLATRTAPANAEDESQSRTILLTTHSPHVVSVAPLKSLVILKRASQENSTIGVSTARLSFDAATIDDLERYIDVNRGECVFAKGILLVEGPAEEYLVPALGKLLGVDFDKFGISVCSVNGVNFEPYVRLFGPQGLDIPFAVLTDKDPKEDGSSLGEPRACNLVQTLMPDPIASQSMEQLLGQASSLGIFLNDHTLEIDLFQSGQHHVMCDTLAELTTNGAARNRGEQWSQAPNSLDPARFIKDINEVGKGRYAQRLASRITEDSCPNYIDSAIRHVRTKLS